MENSKDIEKALKQLKDSQTKYLKYERYYKGDHDLAFATEKFKNTFGSLFREFALNLCPAVCDAPKDKLKITNFKIEEGDSNLPIEVWKLWQMNRMGIRAGEVHKESLKMGDAYVIVWTDPNDKVTIYPQKAKNVTVFYDEETPGKILWAAKTWTVDSTLANAKVTDKQIRLNLYYPDRIEKYISKKATADLPLKATEFEEYKPEGMEFTIVNDFGIVPVFHFANNADIGNFGMSELESAIPIQDALNKSILDMLVAMEFASFRQRWATGIEIDFDDEGNAIPPFKSGVERLWTTENTETKFGDFETADLRQFLEVKESFRVDMACVTGTPLYYFMQTKGEMPSGESLKKSETRFINKVSDRQESFGAIWEDVMAFAMRLEKSKTEIRLFTEWEDPAALSEKEMLENIIIKKEIGISDEQALIEAGYGEEDIAKMLEAKQAAREAMIQSFNSGEGEDDGNS